MDEEDLLNKHKKTVDEWEENEHPKDGEKIFTDTNNNHNLPINIDISALEPVEFTQEDIERFKKPGSVKEYYKNNIQGKCVNHPELGKICFVAKGLNETINKNRHKNLHIVTKIPALIEKAKYDKTENIKHYRNDNIYKFHILYAKANTRNKSKIVLIKVAEDTSGNKFFVLKLTKTTKK